MFTNMETPLQASGGSGKGKSGNILNSGSFTPNTSTFTPIEIGFVPTYIVFWQLITASGQASIVLYDVANDTFYRWYNQQAGADATSTYGGYIKMEGTTLKYKSPGSAGTVVTNYMAVKE